MIVLTFPSTTASQEETMPRTYTVTLSADQIFGFADLVRRLGTHTMTQDGGSHLRTDLADALDGFASLLPEPDDADADAYLAAVKAGELRNWGMDAEPLTETPEEWRAKYDARQAAEAAAVPVPAPAPEDEALARLRAAMAGETPLEGLDEQIRHDGAEWIAVSPGGRLWVIRWFSGTGNVAGIDGNSYVTRFRGTAADLPAARREAARIAALIADGKTKEEAR